jgi:hypothetical protein
MALVCSGVSIIAPCALGAPSVQTMTPAAGGTVSTLNQISVPSAKQLPVWTRTIC